MARTYSYEIENATNKILGVLQSSAGLSGLRTKEIKALTGLGTEVIKTRLSMLQRQGKVQVRGSNVRCYSLVNNYAKT